MSDGRPATEVEIFGTVYPVRGSDDDARLRELAAAVDGKMREIADRMATDDPAEIAILAALNLADELFQLKRTQDGERVEIQERVVALTGELNEALRS